MRKVLLVLLLSVTCAATVMAQGIGGPSLVYSNSTMAVDPHGNLLIFDTSYAFTSVVLAGNVETSVNIPVTVPPLRDRPEDLPLLVNHFLRKYLPAARKNIVRVQPDSLAALANYDWPGNVRQLENTIERAVALETGDELHVELPVERAKARAAAAGVGTDGLALPLSIPAGSVLPESMDMEKYVADIERSLLKSALQQSNGVQARAADVLKISYRSFRHLVKKYEI